MNKEILLTMDQWEGSILLNEGVLDALDWPRQVQIMIIPPQAAAGFSVSGSIRARECRGMGSVSASRSFLHA